MTYILLQNYTNMAVGEHGIQTFKGVVVVLLLLLVFVVVVWRFCPQRYASPINVGQMVCPKKLQCQFSIFY